MRRKDLDGSRLAERFTADEIDAAIERMIARAQLQYDNLGRIRFMPKAESAAIRQAIGDHLVATHGMRR